MSINLTAEERQQILAAADNLEQQDPEGFKDIFCECWPCTSKLLNFLKKYLPDSMTGILQFLIELGDGIHKKCPTKP